MFINSMKKTAHYLAWILTLPVSAGYIVYAVFLGEQRAAVALSQRASRWSGLFGEYLRYSVLHRVIRHLGTDVVISFGTILSKPEAKIDNGVYIGAYCLLGRVEIGKNALLADHVCIPSGSRQHRFDSLSVPLKEQGGELSTIHIGEDTWLGSGAVILADVGSHCIVAAGAVVTKPIDDYKIVAGNPAKIIGDRREKSQ